ncbi:MAG: DUF6072 family protein [Gammaproteobacteria bacterium]
MALENDTQRVSMGAQLFNFVKLVGDIALIPGTSLLMQGKVPQGGTHALLGFLAKAALGPVAGTVGWLLLAANSYAKSSSGKYLHDYVVNALPDVKITADEKTITVDEDSDKAKPAARSAK